MAACSDHKKRLIQLCAQAFLAPREDDDEDWDEQEERTGPSAHTAALNAAGGVAGLLQLLSSGPSAATRSAAAVIVSELLSDRSVDSTREQLLAARCAPALVQHLSSPQASSEACVAACAALVHVLRQSRHATEAYSEVLEAGAAPGLVRLLDSGSTAVQCAALQLLYELCISGLMEAADAVGAAGAGGAAIRLLNAATACEPPNAEVQRDTVDLIYALTCPVVDRDSEAVEDDGLPPVVFPEQRLQALAADGAVTALCSMLCSRGQAADEGARPFACVALKRFQDCPAAAPYFTAAIGAAVPALVQSYRLAARSDAADTRPLWLGELLIQLAHCQTLRPALAEAGAVEAAVHALLLCRQVEQAANLLICFSQSAQERQRAVAAGAINALVDCLQVAVSCSEDTSAARVMLGKQRSRSGIVLSTAETGAVASALRCLAAACPEHQEGAKKAGALQLLLKLVVAWAALRGRIHDPPAYQLSKVLGAVHALASSRDWRIMAATDLPAVLRGLADWDNSDLQQLALSALQRIEEEAAAAAAAEAALLEEEEQVAQQQQQPSAKAAKRQRQRERQRAAAAAAAAAAQEAAAVEAVAEEGAAEGEAHQTDPAAAALGTDEQAASDAAQPHQQAQAAGAAAVQSAAGPGREVEVQEAPAALPAQASGGSGSGGGSSSSLQPSGAQQGSKARRRQKKGAGRSQAAPVSSLPSQASAATQATLAADASTAAVAEAVADAEAAGSQALNAAGSEPAELELLLQHLGVGDSAEELGSAPAQPGTPAASAPPVAAASAASAAAVAVEHPAMQPHAALPTAATLAAAAIDPALLADLVCPLTLETMRDPVVAADGSTYERAAISDWITRQQAAGQAPCSPLTGAPLSHLQLSENRLARALIANMQAAGLLSP